MDAKVNSDLDDAERLQVAENVLRKAAQLEDELRAKQPGSEVSQPAQDSQVRDQPAVAGEKSLYLMGDDGELQKIVKDRFLIGRGKHCDLVINSGKVSREHAAIIREGDDYFVEDLGSSNGTWFNKQRIKRRKVDDGDEYFICSDKVKCVIR